MIYIKKLNILFLILITLFFLGLVMLTPIQKLLTIVPLTKFQIEYSSLFIKMGFIFFVGYLIIKKNNIKPIAGLSSSYNWTHKALNAAPFYLFIIGIASVASKDFSEVVPFNILLLLFGCLAVGFAEEFLFRGIIQSLLLKKYAHKKNGIVMSVFFAALIFGLFHLLNLFKNGNVTAVIIQVVYATIIGFFFGVLVLKTNKIIPLAITHALINFFFSLQFLPSLNTSQNNSTDETSVAAILIVLPLLIIGFINLRKLDKDLILEKTNASL